MKVVDDDKCQHLSLFQAIVLWKGETAVQYPKRCAICGTPTKGNRITGFRMGCNCDKEVVR